MQCIGIDIGSSFIKASVIETDSGQCIGAASVPEREMPISAARPGWAEQDPDLWWQHCCRAVRDASAKAAIAGPLDIRAIGISYQMHGLVLLGKNGLPLRPAIIWCDGRAVDIGNNAFQGIGAEVCLRRFLNSPGNFTASKLKWVKDHEPAVFNQTSKILLPGDYIAYCMTGRAATSIGGLSEAILWDFSEHKPASALLDYYGIPDSFLPDVVPTFGIQGELSQGGADSLGLARGTSVTYRAGDQPNNAFSLNVLDPGELAATAGTSGVIYGVTDELTVDPASRVNVFAHVNHSERHKRLGVLLCVNGTGIANAWIKRMIGDSVTYKEMDRLAKSVPIGSDGLCIIPFGNGPERMLGNLDIGASLHGLDFNRHTKAHFCRAVQEGIAFALHHGMQVMKSMGMNIRNIRAGHSNMFQSDVFRNTLAGTTRTVIELYATDGAQGAARGAGVGRRAFPDFSSAFRGLTRETCIEPEAEATSRYAAAFARWQDLMENEKKFYRGS
jgi:xylulokinase